MRICCLEGLAEADEADEAEQEQKFSKILCVPSEITNPHAILN